MFNYLPFVFYLLVLLIVFIIIIVGVVVFFISRNRNINNMDINQNVPRETAGDFFINLGSIIALGTVVGNLIGLLFTVIDKAYPPISNGYYYGSTYSISFPVATLIIFFPIYILLMWLSERSYVLTPEKRRMGVRKWLSCITLFFAGLAIAGDLVTVIYYFIDGQELTAGFIMKVLSVLVVALAIFFYYIYDSMGKLNSISRKVWTGLGLLIILFSVFWGFSVLGSPRTQQLFKYDEQKVNNLQSINSQIKNFYYDKKVLPANLNDISSSSYGYNYTIVDSQTNKPYEYLKATETEYQLCAEFNKDSKEADASRPVVSPSQYQYGEYSDIRSPYDNVWTHPAGHYCFKENVTPSPVAVPYNPVKMY